MPWATGGYLGFKLHVVPSAVYTLVSAFIKADECLNSGGAQ